MNGKTIIMCPACADNLRAAGYEVKETESCDKREKCFWCRNRGFFSVYSAERRARGCRARQA